MRILDFLVVFLFLGRNLGEFRGWDEEGGLSYTTCEGNKIVENREGKKVRVVVLAEGCSCHSSRKVKAQGNSKFYLVGCEEQRPVFRNVAFSRYYLLIDENSDTVKFMLAEENIRYLDYININDAILLVFGSELHDKLVMQIVKVKEGYSQGGVLTKILYLPHVENYESGRVYLGSPDWVYEEEVLQSEDLSTVWMRKGTNTFYFLLINDEKVRHQLNISVENAKEGRKRVTYYYPMFKESNPVFSLYKTEIDDSFNLKLSKLKIDFDVEKKIKEPILYHCQVSKDFYCILTNREQDAFYIVRNEVNDKLSVIFQEKNKFWIRENTRHNLIVRNNKMYIVYSEVSKKNSITAVDLLDSTTKNFSMQDKYDVQKLLCASDGYIVFLTNYIEDLPFQNHIILFDLASSNDTCLTCSLCKNVVFSVPDRHCTNFYAVCYTENSLKKLMFTVTANQTVEIFNQSVTYFRETAERNCFMRPKNGQFIRFCEVKGRNPSYDADMFIVFNFYNGPESVITNTEPFIIDQNKTSFEANLLTTFDNAILVQVDGRGTLGFNNNYTFSVKNRLGELESDDIATIINFYSRLYNNTVTKRCVAGWSYGGYLSLYALLNHNEIVKCSIAVAPVTDWRLYDSIYTERYVVADPPPSLLDVNLTKVTNSSILLVHSTDDDNVHYENSFNFYNFFKNNADSNDIEFVTFTDDGHSLSKNRKPLYGNVTWFLSNFSVFNHSQPF